ncbi:hypothetical protein [Burkholderia ambifaria]|uniref:hypothetical protein n=1 Tax=Burkholderia ambifaria TaxID=152480 RepID=UPI001BA291C5|nr:hypothetical protein [Burkholderia ambifaria]MBR8221259.1 hypothetical protein [Burkholderia ambifaria]
MTTTDNSRADALTDHLYILSVNEEAMEEAIERFGGSSTGEALKCVLHAQKQLRALLVTPVEQHEAAPAVHCEKSSDAQYYQAIADQYARDAQPAPSAPLEGTGNGADERDVLNRLVVILESGQAYNGIAHDNAAIYAKALRDLLESRAPRTEVAGAVPFAWIRANVPEHLASPIAYSASTELLKNAKEGYLPVYLAPQPPSADAAAAPAEERAAFDYDDVVSICDAHGIGLPVDCIEMVVEIVRHAAPPAQEKAND